MDDGMKAKGAGQRRFLHQVRADLFWIVAAFAVFQLVLSLGVERWWPQVRDPDYAAREQRLRACRNEAPGRPLVVMLGSSRTQLGLQAARLSKAADLPPAVVFNFGMAGSGPVLELVCLRRLLATGCRPDLLFVEVTPPMLSQGDGVPLEEGMLIGPRLQAAEMARARKYLTHPWPILARWGLAQCLPANWRAAALQNLVGLDRSRGGLGPDNPFLTLDDHGWQPMILEATPEQRVRLTGLAYRQYAPALRDFTLAVEPARAVRDLLDLCRRRDIPVALVLMPEASAFRALYPPAAWEKVEEFLGRLCRRHHVPLVDARCWVGDNGFYDTHHLLPEGAAVFTDRFGREVLRPLLHQMSVARHP
jgi:hypothetical protein